MNERETLHGIIRDIAWMARRYADGRRTYATGMYNDAIRRALALGVKLEPGGDETIWARDGMGRGCDGLTDEEAAMGRDPDPSRRHDGRTHWHGCWREHPECAAALLERIAASGVEHDDARVGYVVVQVDRVVWDRLREAI